MKADRDELIYVPQAAAVGGFMCPKCLSIAIGDSWAAKAKYCPECGQHIKVISIKDFKDLEKGLAKIGADDVEKVAEKYLGNISGIYKNRLDKLTGNENYIAGQMELSDFIS